MPFVITPRKRIYFMLLFISISVSAFCQRINLATDTASEQSVMQRKADFDKGLSGRMNPTKAVMFNIGKLGELLQKCEESGETDIQFQFGRSRSENKPTIIIRVPRSVFQELGETSTGSLLFSLDNKDFFENKGIAAKRYVYLDMGTICPPPASCN